MKISEVIEKLQKIQSEHGDCECGCLCETDDIWDDDIEYFFKTVENVQFHKGFKISSCGKDLLIDCVDLDLKCYEQK